MAVIAGFVLKELGVFLVEELAARVLIEEWDYGLKLIEKKGNKDAVTLGWDRYTMDDNGMYIGYEIWEAKLGLISASDLGWNNTPRIIWGANIINVNKCDIKLKHHPKKNKYYYPPDEDFGWDEFEHKFNYLVEELERAERVVIDKRWYLRVPGLRVPGKEIDMGTVEDKLDEQIYLKGRERNVNNKKEKEGGIIDGF